MTVDASRVSNAIVVWTGWGISPWPSRDQDRVIAYFGEDIALDLLPLIRHLENEFYESDAKDTVDDLAEMGEAAAARFRGLHPEISADAVRALAWCYTYDYK